MVAPIYIPTSSIGGFCFLEEYALFSLERLYYIKQSLAFVIFLRQTGTQKGKVALGKIRVSLLKGILNRRQRFGR